ncbi:response regulator PleD [Sphingomonas panacis]|uniref:diguanylate cyclase n=1 Tax=Sphingomonas panacis TaxID=1560345 RepID=A0A1B3ZF45_9SPHN|nr:GGDEF domain-containing protein [Sphingomonas panacis]AOH86055.1 response regulator PleD [Sphingomonas panacis]
MRFYEATRFLFPRSFHLRLFTLCFGAVHLPLIAFCITEAVLQQWEWRVFVPLLVATLTGTVAAIGAVWALLAPVAHATAMLRTLQRGQRIAEIPVGGPDLVGELLRGVARAAAETSARIERLTKAAERDLLTGLRNRRGFLDAAAPLLHRDRTSVVAMLDLDHFKTTNDRFGHEVGDAVLREFAHRLNGALRPYDLSARWGGEEFAVLLPDTGLDEAREIVERLRTGLYADPITAGSGHSLTFSCGMAVARDYPTLVTAMRDADEALYGAKDAGRNRTMT